MTKGSGKSLGADHDSLLSYMTLGYSVFPPISLLMITIVSTFIWLGFFSPSMIQRVLVF